MTIIYQLPIQQPGMVGVLPNQKFMVSGDNLATITTAGYLNQVDLESNPLSNTDILQILYNYNLQTTVGTYGVFTVSISTLGVITLALAVQANGATFSAPSVANHLAVFSNTTGNLVDDVATAINAGNIQAGLSGTAGTLASFPATAANGSLIIQAVAAGGAFNTTIASGTIGQSTVYTIPDIGAATGGIVVSSGAIRMKSVAGFVNAGGSATTSVTDAFSSAGANILAQWNTSANPVNIQKVTPGAGSFTVLSSGDPGASTLNYVIMK